MTLTEARSEFLRFERDEAAPDLLWIVFSHVDIPRGKFAQRHVFQHVAGCKLFVNCRGNSWYQQGISKRINSVEKLVEALVATAAAFPRCRVVGHSMGAYLALAMQHLAPIEAAVVISPEPELLVPQSRSAVNGVRPQAGWESLVARFSSRTRIAPGLCLFGAYDPVDAYFLAKLDQHQELYRCVLAAPYHHGVTEYLTNRRRYMGLLADPLGEGERLRREKLLAFPSDFGSKHAFLQYYALYRMLRDRAPADRIAAAAEQRATWDNNGWQTLRAFALRRIGRVEEALEIAWSAIRPDSHFAEPVLEYAQCLKQLGAAAQAAGFLDELEGYRIAESVKARVRDLLAPAPAVAPVPDQAAAEPQPEAGNGRAVGSEAL